MGRKFESYNRVPVVDEEPKCEVENAEPESFNRVPVKDEIDETEFKPFDKVLARNDEDHVWSPELYSHCNKDAEYPHRVVGGGMFYKYCIPYEGNEHLAGTSINLKPKRWRAIVGDIYYLINNEIEVDYAYENSDSVDDRRWQMGNYFKTREDATAAVEKIKNILKQQNND